MSIEDMEALRDGLTNRLGFNLAMGLHADGGCLHVCRPWALFIAEDREGFEHRARDG